LWIQLVIVLLFSCESVFNAVFHLPFVYGWIKIQFWKAVIWYFSGVEVPIAILGAEHDSLSPPKLLKQFQQVLNAKPEVEWNL